MIAFESVASPEPVGEREMIGHVWAAIRCKKQAVSPIDRSRYDLLLVSQRCQGALCRLGILEEESRLTVLSDDTR